MFYGIQLGIVNSILQGWIDLFNDLVSKCLTVPENGMNIDINVVKYSPAIDYLPVYHIVLLLMKKHQM